VGTRAWSLSIIAQLYYHYEGLGDEGLEILIYDISMANGAPKPISRHRTDAVALALISNFLSRSRERRFDEKALSRREAGMVIVLFRILFCLLVSYSSSSRWGTSHPVALILLAPFDAPLFTSNPVRPRHYFLLSPY